MQGREGKGQGNRIRQWGVLSKKEEGKRKLERGKLGYIFVAPRKFVNMLGNSYVQYTSRHLLVKGNKNVDEMEIYIKENCKEANKA